MPDTTPVREVMTSDVVTLRADQSVAEAADVLAGKQIGAAPVVDDRGKLVGLLRDEDLIVSEARLHVPTVISFLGADLVLPSSLHRFEHELKKAAGATVGDVMITEFHRREAGRHPRRAGGARCTTATSPTCRSSTATSSSASSPAATSSGSSRRTS